MSTSKKNVSTQEVVRNQNGTISLPPEAEFKSYKAMKEWLTLREMEEEEKVNVNEPAGPLLEGLVALQAVLKRMFGLISISGEKCGFCGVVHDPPSLINVKTGIDTAVQVPWGNVGVPALDNHPITTGYSVDSKGEFQLRLKSAIARKHAKKIKEIAEAVRDEIEAHSIYRGKAFAMNFDNVQERVAAEGPEALAPEFLDLSHVKEEELIFSKETRRLVDAALLTPIKKWERLKQLGASPKRGALLVGDPGTGKTMTAKVIAKVATEHGWTFVYVRQPEQLAEALAFAKRYQPAWVFCEDIDRILEETDERSAGRNQDANQLLNTVNGLDSDAEVYLVLTTNFVDKIEKYLPELLRYGRLDAVLKLERPDAGAAARLIKLYAKSSLRMTEPELHEAGSRLQGNIPPAIKEAVDRARLYGLTDSDSGDITFSAVMLAAKSMEDQTAMLKPPENTDKDVEIARALGNALGERVAAGLLRLDAKVAAETGKMPLLTDGEPVEGRQ